MTSELSRVGHAGSMAAAAAADSTTRAQLEQLNADLVRSQRELVHVLADLRRSNRELRTTQLQLIQAAKLESLGRVSAGVAHEVKNPLAIILMGVSYLETALENPDPQVRKVLGQLREAITRADAIVRGLLDFSAPHELELTESDLNQIIEQALLLLEFPAQDAHVTLTRHLLPGLPRVRLDRLKIEQVLVNLSMNSIQAMRDGGILELTTTTLSDTTGRARGVLVEVTDNGPGIPEEQLVKIFDPFFTTNQTSGGSGLGLAVAKTIADLHGAQLTIANRAGGGVSAQLTFNLEGSREDHEGAQSPDHRR